MGFCKETIYYLLGLSHYKNSSPTSTTTTTTQSSSHHKCGHKPPISGCFCLIPGETQKPPPNELISGNKYSSTFSFLDNACNGGNGSLPSCTESLGFESSDNPMEESMEEVLLRSRSTAVRSRWKTTVDKVRRQETKFPPPLPSLNQNGQRSFYLRSVRKNGRLELTEVRIQRPEVFRASRQDGRLRLTL